MSALGGETRVGELLEKAAKGRSPSSSPPTTGRVRCHGFCGGTYAVLGIVTPGVPGNTYPAAL
jgi:hypothetical protein